MTRPSVITIDADAHCYPFDGNQDDPSSGRPNGNPSLVEIAETFGVLVEDRTADVWGDHPWCWVYRFTGPRDNVYRAISEYWGEDYWDDMELPLT